VPVDFMVKPLCAIIHGGELDGFKLAIIARSVRNDSEDFRQPRPDLGPAQVAVLRKLLDGPQEATEIAGEKGKRAYNRITRLCKALQVRGFASQHGPYWRIEPAGRVWLTQEEAKTARAEPDRIRP
jgi:hypothetical protein